MAVVSAIRQGAGPLPWGRHRPGPASSARHPGQPRGRSGRRCGTWGSRAPAREPGPLSVLQVGQRVLVPGARGRTFLRGTSRSSPRLTYLADRPIACWMSVDRRATPAPRRRASPPSGRSMFASAARTGPSRTTGRARRGPRAALHGPVPSCEVLDRVDAPRRVKSRMPLGQNVSANESSAAFVSFSRRRSSHGRSARTTGLVALLALGDVAGHVGRDLHDVDVEPLPAVLDSAMRACWMSSDARSASAVSRSASFWPAEAFRLTPARS